MMFNIIRFASTAACVFSLALQECRAGDPLETFLKKPEINLSLSSVMQQSPQSREVHDHLSKLTVQATTTKDGKSYGKSYPATMPWVLFAAQVVQLMGEQNDGPVCVGDWGCGHGAAASVLLAAGANVKAIEMQKPIAHAANATLWKTAQILGYSKQNPHYSVGAQRLESPGKSFLNRKNDVNVCFNVMHYMTPAQNDAFLKHLYQNTKDGGYVILAVDSPNVESASEYSVNSENSIRGLYAKRAAQGVRYPGYSIQNMRHYVPYPDMETRAKLLSFDYGEAYPVPEDLQGFAMGDIAAGVWDGQHKEAPVRRLTWSDVGTAHDPLKVGIPYMWEYLYSIKNLMTCETLRSLLQEQGFQNIKGFSLCLNPEETALILKSCAKGEQTAGPKCVVIAQKVV